MEEWKVTQEGLTQLVPLLRETQSPTSDQQAVQRAFTELSKHPDYLEYLLYVFVELKGEPLPSRAASGVLLRKSMKNIPVSERTKELIRKKLLLCLDDSNQLIRSTCASITTTFISYFGFANWPSLLFDLNQLTSHPSQNVLLGTFETLLLLCEDHSQALDSEELGRPLNQLIPKFLAAFKSPSDQIRKYALSSVYQFITFSPNALNINMHLYIEGLLSLHNDPSVEVRKEVCRGLVVITEVKTEHLERFMMDVVLYMIQTMQHPDEQLALEATEFWSAIASTNICEDYVSEVLPKLLPLLLDRMIYLDDDIALMTCDDDDSMPDEAKDIKPFLYNSKHSTKDEEDDDGEVSEWNLRKSAALGLDRLSEVFEDKLLPHLLPLLQVRLSDANWKARESAVLVLGAIAYGCEGGLTPHLQALVPYLIALIGDKHPLVSSISCWTLGRHAPWLCQNPTLLDHTVTALLTKMLDRNKKAQEAACSAIATISEEARELMIQFMNPCIQTFLTAFTRYQAKNTFLLYDAITAFAEAVGPDLNRPDIVNALMPPILQRWSSYQDDDLHLLRILECLVSIATSLRAGFQPFALPIYQRCIRIIETVLITQDDNSHHAGADFLICSLDMICGMIDGLRAGSEGLLANSNLILLVLRILKDQNPPDVIQSCLAVIGDISKNCISYLRPHMNDILHCLTIHLSDPTYISVCNNASWAIGEISIRIPREEFLPHFPNIFKHLCELVNKEKLNKYLKENASITLGRIATALPSEMASVMPHYMQSWCAIVRNLRDPEGKESAIKGLCLVVGQNPAAASQFLPQIISVFVSFDGQRRPTPDRDQLKSMISQIMNGYKNQSPQHWDQLVSVFPQSTQEKIKSFI
eukprot:TRINITY_DN7565_c0_g1_i1.p1 TRINITY_DN7565_c0_g1~~TRINITY_DN7565_c0_g1_i1.p1  ORF type:complete len:903 (-),score=276.56 TRINITY_DN7565_c0_g1_i1:34-2640(-)